MKCRSRWRASDGAVLHCDRHKHPYPTMHTGDHPAMTPPWAMCQWTDEDALVPWWRRLMAWLGPVDAG